MKTVLTSTLFSCAVVFLFGCQPATDPAVTQKLKSMTEQINSLEIQGLILSNALETISAQQWNDHVAQTAHDFAPVNPDEPTHNRVDTDLCPMLLYTEKAEPYLDGYKVRMNLGNPSAILFDGFELAAHWGPKATKTLQGEEWRAKQHSITNKINVPLPSGTWTPFDLVIAPANAEELRRTRVQVRVGRLSLVQGK